jgi:hypothetical protein
MGVQNPKDQHTDPKGLVWMGPLTTDKSNEQCVFRWVSRA